MSSTHQRRQLPSLKALQAFEAAGRLQNLTRAAEELRVTQSAVSRHVQELEAQLGVALFARRGRSVTLTAAGRELSAAATDAFDRLATGVASLRARPAILTVSMLPSFAAKWLAPRLVGFYAAHPAIDLRISASRALVDFEADGVDAAIRYGRGDWLGVEAVLLAREEVFPVCGPALVAALDLRTPADLARAPLLHGDILEGWPQWLRAAGVPHLDATRGPRFTDDVSLLQATADGLGVALGRSVLVARDLAEGRLVAPFGPRIPADYAYWFVTPRRGAAHPGIASFHHWLRAEFAREFA